MIVRDVAAAAQGRYDLVIIGGGIQGACLLLEAARCGKRVVLLERDDFGGATSWNSLRIIHGGLRYLQSADLRRYRESVADRRWFFRAFADLVQPLPCVMPLHGHGLKRPMVLRAALLANELLGASRGINDRNWQRGRVLNVLETLSVAPFTRLDGLQGAAMWYDGMMRSPQRVVIELIRWACSLGATALNYVQAERLIQRDGAIRAVRAVDGTTGEVHEIETAAVANCAGPWAGRVASAGDGDGGPLFRPSLAFNLLLDREPLSQCGLAVSPPRAGGSDRAYFLCPFHGRILAGTSHVPWHGDADQPRPTHQQVGQMLDDLNAAIPGFQASHDDILRVYSGLLPTETAGSYQPAKRTLLVDHSRDGGPRGLLTIRGVKFTTARHTAQRALRHLFPDARARAGDTAVDRPQWTCPVDLLDPDSPCTLEDELVAETLERIVHEEAVVRLDDLLLRRTDWLADPRDAQRVSDRVKSLLPELACAAVDEPRPPHPVQQWQAAPAGGRA